MNPELCEIYEKVHRRKLGIGIRNWTNKCKYCDKGFFQSQKSIKRHEMAHTGENHGGKFVVKSLDKNASGVKSS